MPARIKTLKQLLQAATDMQWTFICYYDHDNVDYIGKDQDQALEALEGCDEMRLRLLDVAGGRIGWALIVNDHGQDPEEQIADHSALGRLNFLLSDPDL